MVLSGPTSMIVSADGMATSTAGCTSSASKHSVMIRAESSGLTASWKRTWLSASSPMAARARWVVSFRDSPPSSIEVTFS